MAKANLRDINTTGKRVLVRVDFNVPLDANKHVADDTRILAAIPTIEFLLSQGAVVILMSHLGRPEGERIAKMSLAPVARRLTELLGKPVAMAADCVGEDVLMLSDGNAEFTAAVGLEMDGSGFGLGTRSQRYAMVIDDGVVSILNVESGPGLDVSSAETILEQL